MSGDVAAWLFDFDGVLVESNRIKEDAFVALYADQPRQHQAIRELHRREGALSRDRKLVMIEREIFHRSIDAGRRAELCRRFSELVMERIVDCEPVPGTCETLKQLHGRVPMYVVSGTPQSELRRIVDARGMGRYFVEVLGSPTPKPLLVESIVRRHAHTRSRVVLVGDARLDLEAARTNGIGFVARIGAHACEELRRWPHRVPDMHDVIECAREAIDAGGELHGGRAVESRASARWRTSK